MSTAPMDLNRYAQFCAPTALATLLGCTRLEAAEYLTDEGCNVGGGGTANWDRVLEGLGGSRFDPQTDEDRARYDEAWERYIQGDRKTPPKHALKRPTVAQTLKRYPEGLYVVWTTTHTLVARDGEVLRDTLSTNSMRARVRCLYRFRELEAPEASVGLPKEEAEELDRHHESIRASKARRRERRKARRERRKARRAETLSWLNLS